MQNMQNKLRCKGAERCRYVDAPNINELLLRFIEM